MIRYGSNRAGLCQPLWKLIQIIFSCLTKLKQSNVNFTAKKQLNVIFFSRKTNQIRNLFLPIPVYCKSLLGGFSELKEKKRKKIKGKSLQFHNKLEYTQDNKFVKVTIVSVEHSSKDSFYSLRSHFSFVMLIFFCTICPWTFLLFRPYLIIRACWN